MTDYHQRVVSDTLITAAINLRSSLHRSFYICLVFSAFTIFLIFEETYGDSVFRLQAQFEDAFTLTETVLQLSDDINEDPTLLRSFLEFLEPFVAIDSAAEQAVVGVDVDDPRWLNLDPRKRDLARSTTDNIQWFHHQAGSYVGDNLRELPVFNISEYSKWLIFPERAFDNENALRNLRASLYVARELGQSVNTPTNWPESFYFYDYIDEAELSDLSKKIRVLRNKYTHNDIIIQTNRLTKLCEDNSIDDCSRNFLDLLLLDEPNRLTQEEDLKISVSFFPVGVAASIIIRFAPIALLALSFQFLGHEQRWRRFVRSPSIVGEFEHTAKPEMLWAITDAIHSRMFFKKGFSVNIHSFAMRVLVTLALMAPFAAQVAVVFYGWQKAWSFGWMGLVCICAVLSGACLVVLLGQVGMISHAGTEREGDAG